jgi:hypothetical protein
MVDAAKDAVTVSIVGTESTQGGGVAPTPTGTVALVDGPQPNLIINVVAPTVAVVVRAANVFLTTFVGLLTAAGVGVGGDVLASGDLWETAKSCAAAAAIAAGIATIKNLITIFGRLEGKYPIGTGSI